MAGIRVELYDIDNRCMAPDKLISMELSKDIDAACDGLRLNFYAQAVLPEIDRVLLYNDNELIFNGYADTQRETVDSGGSSCFIYARSSASLLTDSAAEPATYCMPSVNALFCKNAMQFGFINRLENLCSESNYQVGSGVSCYGAINNFVYALTGKGIIVTPNNELVIAEPREEADISQSRIISQKRLINRGQAIGRISYKKSTDTDYKYRLVSRLMQSKGIKNSVMKNVSGSTFTDKERIVLNAMEKANEGYYCFEAVLDGFVCLSLLNTVRIPTELAGNEPWKIRSIAYTLDRNGFKTKLLLFKQIDLKEIVYVD